MFFLVTERQSIEPVGAILAMIKSYSCFVCYGGYSLNSGAIEAIKRYFKTTARPERKAKSILSH